MIKSDLRERAYSEVTRNPKKSRIHTLWISLTAVLIAGTFIAVFAVVGPVIGERRDAIDPIGDFMEMLSGWFGGFGDVIFVLLFFGICLIVTLFIYLFLKLIVTILFCNDKRNRDTHNNIKLKMLEHKALPICDCKEAFKIWQIVLIYLIPVILMYAIMR